MYIVCVGTQEKQSAISMSSSIMKWANITDTEYEYDGLLREEIPLILIIVTISFEASSSSPFYSCKCLF
jgi:hypothetical protein